MEVAWMPSSSSLEDATSLRARALSTLKLKRKRPVPQRAKISASSSLPIRPLPSTDSFLDYGQEEEEAPSSPSAPVAVDEQPSTGNPESDDVSMREEGEISDEEVTGEAIPVKEVSVRRPTPTGPKRDRELEAKVSLLERLSDAVPTGPRSMPSTQKPKCKPSIPPPSSTRKQFTSPPSKRPRISPDSVRPNVPFNQSDYDRAKDIILDLLGWGVAPEYLVDCGLTREMVYYVFAELNLQIPHNLDTKGLVPYTPETIREFTISQHQGSPETSSLQPQVPSLSFSSTAPSTSAPPTPRLQNDLIDMERQRRQELVARRAVLASRKDKALYRDEPSKPKRVADISSVAHSAIVDDFLNSITSTTDNKAVIPEVLFAASGDPSSSSTSRLTTPVLDDDVDEVSKPPSPSPSNDDPLPPPTSSGSANSEFSIITHTLRSSPEPITPVDPMPIFSGRPLPFVSQYPPRRSAKRPVASDFVDVEGFGPHRMGSLGSQQQPTSHALNAAVRRKTGNGSFVNVRHTKCVIDLSDTESESDEGEDMPSTATAVTALRTSVNPPPILVPNAAATQALLEKEREIQRMKDLIAQHEQKTRLRKMGSTAPSTAPSKRPSPSPSNDVRQPILVPSSLSTPAVPPPEAVQESIPLATEAPTQQGIPLEEPLDAGINVAVIELAQSSNDVVEEVPLETKTADPLEPDDDVPPEPEPEPRGFASYRSLFSLYPSLRLSLPLPSSESGRVDLEDQRLSSDANRSSASSSSVSTALEHFTASILGGLKTAMLIRSLDPSQQICQYEIPGGGACHDASCQDLHLSRVETSNVMRQYEPSDDDVARYLYSSIASISTAPPLDKVLSAVRDDRLKDPNAPLETCIARVVNMFCLPSESLGLR